MPTIPSLINYYKPGWKAKAAIKYSLSKFNRADSSSSSSTPPPPPPPPASDVPQPLRSPAASTVLEITDDRSSLDFDGGQPDEYENDILDRTSDTRSSRPSNVSSVLPPAKLEVSLPPELRIDWFAEKFTGIPSNPRKPDPDVGLDQDTKDMLAGKIKDDQGLYETLEDALALHVDSNPSRFVSISGLDLMLPGMSPINNLHPGSLTIPNGLSEPALLKHPRDSITMLTSRLSVTDTPASSALSGTTLARALISNTFAMPLDRLSTSQREGGLTRSDSSVFPRDSVYRNAFSIAPDAPPMPPDAETQYVAPKKPRVERRKQLKRRSSTGSLNNKALPDLPNTTRRTSLVLSMGPEFDVVLKSRPWSSGTIPESSPRRLSNPALVIETTPPPPPPPTTAPTATPKNDVCTLPPLPEGVRRLPDPHSQQQPSASAAVSSPISAQSPLDTSGLEDVLEYYNLGESPAPHPSGAAYRPDFSPILEETSSRSSSAGSPFWNDSKRTPPVGARSPRSWGESLNLGRRPSDARPSSKPMLVPSQNGSSAGLSERSGSLKSSRSFEPPPSDSASSHAHDTRNHSRQRAQSIPLLASSGTENSSREELQQQRPNEDPDSRRRNATEDGHSDGSPSPGRVPQSEASHPSDAPMINVHPPIPAARLQVSELKQRVRPLKIETRSPEAEPTRPELAVPSASSNLSVSSSLVRSRSLPIDGVTFTPTFVISAGVPTAIAEGANGASSSRLTVEKSAFSRYPAVSDPSILLHHHHHHQSYRDDFLGRSATLSMGSPPPYYEAVNQVPVPRPEPSALNAGGPVAPSAPDPLAGPSRSSGEWNLNESRRDGPARPRIRPRPPLPIGPRRPSQGSVPLHASMSFSETLNRSGSIVASVSQPGLSRQRSTRAPLSSSPKFHTPPPKWRGHTMDAARWTFKSSQLQAIVTKAIKQSSEASLIRLLEPEVLNDDIPAEIAVLETQRTDIKTRYKLLARRRALLFDSLASFLVVGNNADEGPGYPLRVLEELSELASTMDHLSEELHSADNQLAHLDSLTQVHTSSALAVALRKLNTSFLKQMAENESLRTELFSVEAERDEAWLQAERIAIELEQLAEAAENPSPIVSNRSSRGSGSVSAHRRSVVALKASVSKRRSGGKRQPSPPALSSMGFRPPEKLVLPLVSARKKPVPISTESALSGSPVLVYSSSSPGTRTLIQTQDELYSMLGLTVPDTSLKRSRSWKGSTPRESISPSSSSSVFTHPVFLSTDSLQRHPQPRARALKRRSASLPPDSTLAQFSSAMAADRNAMLFTFDMLSATDNDDGLST